MVVEFGPHDLAVAEALRSADLVAAVAQVPRVGEKPAGWQGRHGGSTFVPYVVVWPEQTLLGGDLDEPENVGDLVYNLHCWGANPAHARRLSDRARSAMQTITVDGRSIMRVVFDHSLGVTRDPELQPDAWCAKDRYRLLSAPGS